VRRAIVVASLLALLAISAGPAAAGKPIKENLPQSPQVYEAGVACDFAVELDPIAANVKAITFDRPVGKAFQLLSGRLVYRITNLETGASVVRQSSGPGKVSINAAGHTVLSLGGSSVFAFFDGDVTGRGLLRMTGKAKIEIGDDRFSFVRVDLPNKVEDLCQTLG